MPQGLSLHFFFWGWSFAQGTLFLENLKPEKASRRGFSYRNLSGFPKNRKYTWTFFRINLFVYRWFSENTLEMARIFWCQKGWLHVELPDTESVQREGRGHTLWWSLCLPSSFHFHYFAMFWSALNVPKRSIWKISWLHEFPRSVVVSKPVGRKISSTWRDFQEDQKV